jgi:ATP-dependent RNA helicase RhlE
LSFHSLGLDARLVRAIDELGFANPTPIQIGAIPPAHQGKDLLACAMTGSGKTAAFMLPVLNRLLVNPRRATRALVLTPTRELAAQIVEATQDFARHTSLKVAPIFGGVGHRPQEMAFRDKVDIIVACPGRLLDHFKESYGVLPDLEVLVLDEADRMLDMGFLPDLRRVLRHLPPRQQTLFFSATMPPPIAQLTREMLKDPIAIDVERQAKPATGVEQALFPVPGHLKGELIKRLIEQEQVRDAIVFTRTKHRADRLAKQLNSAGITAERIHGNRSQAQRVAALAGFKDGKFRVLVATDIAARGIDINELGHVFNFDVPEVSEDYIHRVGRTARAGATGRALTLCAPDEENEIRAIERAVGRALPRLKLPDFDYSAKAAEALEIPIAERIAAIRAQKSQARDNARQKAERRGGAAQPAAPGRGVAGGNPGGGRGAGGGNTGGGRGASAGRGAGGGRGGQGGGHSGGRGHGGHGGGSFGGRGR